MSGAAARQRARRARWRARKTMRLASSLVCPTSIRPVCRQLRK
jgi:hypothetical protein